MQPCSTSAVGHASVTEKDTAAKDKEINMKHSLCLIRRVVQFRVLITILGRHQTI